jgi:hypothetical protein
MYFIFKHHFLHWVKLPCVQYLRESIILFANFTSCSSLRNLSFVTADSWVYSETPP